MIQRGLEILARTLFCLAAIAGLTACGSGAVGSIVTDPTKITILPAGTDVSPVVLYSGQPTTFSITGGSGAYIVSSSNQAVLPVSGPISGSSLTVVPNGVTTDTTFTLTARDTGTTTPATITLVVRPGLVNNTITITPTSTACSPGICSGDDALVAATISQGGVPLPGRNVQFSVVSGDVRFVTSPAGLPETTALAVTTTTDEAGVARARLRVLATAANQTAIIQITDLTTGAYQRTAVIIAAASSAQAGFFSVPDTVTFTGPDNQHCASGLTSEIFVFGGVAPYTISNSSPNAFQTNTNVVGASGGSFRVTAGGICGTAVIGITDTTGRTIQVNLSNVLGTNNPPPAPLNVVPGSLSLNCTSPSTSTQASAVIVGGQSDTFVAASSNNLVLATVDGRLLTVKRGSGPWPTGTSVVSLTVNVTDGSSIFTVPVTFTGPPGPPAITAAGC